MPYGSHDSATKRPTECANKAYRYRYLRDQAVAFQLKDSKQTSGKFQRFIKFHNYITSNK